MKVFSNCFEGADMWKLTSAGQIFSYILLILSGILVFWLIIRRINRNRRPDVAMQRVARKLAKLGGRGSRVYTRFSLPSGGGEIPVEMLWAARDRLYVVKVLPHGTRISGTEKGAVWKLGGSVSETVPNPLPALDKQRRVLLSLLGANGFGEVHVDPLVVCADTYETPRFKIDGFSSIVNYGGLRAWRRKHPLIRRWFYDIVAVRTLLEGAMIPGKDPEPSGEQ